MILSSLDHRTRRVLALLVGAVILATLAGLRAWPADAMPSMNGPSGLECLDGGPSFDLWATDGRVDMPDGNSVYVWGFVPDASSEAWSPGPNLCVNEGDTVSVTLHNKLDEDVSIVFPGQEDVQAGGAPSQPQFDGSNNLTSLAQAASANGGTLTYSFTAGKPGTYLYESGTDPQKQVQMGLAGALIVRPAGHPDWAYNDSSTAFDPDREYLMLLQEIDPALHEAVEAGRPYDISKFHPRYWTINGRSFPDTLAPNDARYLPNQPYGAMVTVEPFDQSSNPLPALIRYANAGMNDHPIHPHGNHVRLIAHDGYLLKNDSGGDLSYEKFTQVINSGQTWDGLFKWTDLENWSSSNPVPVQLPGKKNVAYGEHNLYSGTPYLGEQEDMPPSANPHNECGEYYFIAHSHAAYEMQNWDQGMGGMTTFFRIDPPGGCQ